MLQTAWHLPFRKLVLAMPITAGIVAVATHVADGPGLDGELPRRRPALPHRPVLSSSVVTNPRVPRKVRHSLNLESGLNDGLALPPVLALTARWPSTPRTSTGSSSCSRTRRSGSSSGWPSASSARCCCRARRRSAPRSAPTRSRSTRSGSRSAAYGVAVLPPEGNGFIAVFVAAIVLGIRRPDIRECFEARPQDVIELVKLGVFLVFGSLLTLDGLFERRDGRRGDRRPSRCSWRGRSRCSSRWRAPSSTRARRRSWRGSGRRASRP